MHRVLTGRQDSDQRYRRHENAQTTRRPPPTANPNARHNHCDASQGIPVPRSAEARETDTRGSLLFR